MRTPFQTTECAWQRPSFVRRSDGEPAAWNCSGMLKRV